MRTYLILKDKAERWNTSEDIQSILAEINAANENARLVGAYSKDGASNLLAEEFDRKKLASKGLKYERLDQLTMDILFGID